MTTHPFANAPLPPHPDFRMGEGGVEVHAVCDGRWKNLQCLFDNFHRWPANITIGQELERACALAEGAFRDQAYDRKTSRAHAEDDINAAYFYNNARLAVRGMMEKEANKSE